MISIIELEFQSQSVHKLKPIKEQSLQKCEGPITWAAAANASTGSAPDDTFSLKAW